MASIKNKEQAEKALVQVATLKTDIKDMEEELNDVQQALCTWLEDKGQKSIGTDTPTGKLKGTRVAGARMILDEPRLKKILGARLFNRATKRVIDKKKLEDLITKGEVKSLDVASCMDEVTNKPYIKVTKR